MSIDENPTAPTTYRPSTSTQEGGWLTEEQQKIWRNYLLGSAKLNQYLDTQLRNNGLDLSEYEILVNLSETPEHRLRMSELAIKVHQSRSRLTHTVERMEREKLLTRSTCPTDRRGVWAELTPKGLALLDLIAPDHAAAVKEVFVNVASSEDFNALGRVFQAVINATE